MHNPIILPRFVVCFKFPLSFNFSNHLHVKYSDLRAIAMDHSPGVDAVLPTE